MDGPVTFVDEETMRRLFEGSGLHARILDNELLELVVESDPASPRSRQRPGTKSERVIYFDSGEWVAECHRFVHPDGTLGGSGMLDPKALLIDDTQYVLRKAL